MGQEYKDLDLKLLERNKSQKHMNNDMALIEQQQAINDLESELKQIKNDKNELQKQLNEVQNINNVQTQRINELETQLKGYYNNYAQIQHQRMTTWNAMSDEQKEQYTQQYQQQYAQYYQQKPANTQQNEQTYLTTNASSEYDESLSDDNSHHTEHSHASADKNMLRTIDTLHGKNTMLDIHEYISHELKDEMEKDTDKNENV